MNSSKIEQVLFSRKFFFEIMFIFQGVKYLVDLLNLKQIGAFLVEDFTTSWQYILIALAFAAIISV